MLPAVKSLVYKSARLTGVNAALIRTQWRSRRLLILCYHGISLDDEHQWSHLYLSQAAFRDRLERLKQAGCHVLPLGAALAGLKAGSLPPRAVALTFDDGFYDFYAQAWPVVREFHYPVTVYLTSYYSEYNEPVFDLACPYLLWKARGRQFAWPEMDVEPVALDTGTAAAAATRIKAACRERRLTAPETNEVLRELAQRLGMDFEDFRRRRLLRIMTPAEAGELARQGVDFQLHGHWHRVSRSRERFRDELHQNRVAMARFGVEGAAHYCYPTGLHLPEFSRWLTEFGVRSAVTCEMGFASPASDFYALPRLVDSPGLGADEFSGWLSGLASWMPRREYPPDPNQLLEAAEEAPASKAAAASR